MKEKNGACLSCYGPYSKKYMGLSRVMKESRVEGARFDLVAHPTYANSAVPAPNVCVPSGYHPWDAAEDGTAYTYRCELIWKDQLYADVSFFEMEPEVWGVRAAFVNHTDRVQNCLLNLFAAMEYPQPAEWTAEYPEKHAAWDALAYGELSYAKPRPWEHLTPDGHRRGEISIPGFTGGKGLGETWYALAMSHLGLGMFGAAKGDVVRYEKELTEDYENAVLTVRYRTWRGETNVAFNSTYGELTFEGSAAPRMTTLPLGPLPAGSFRLELTAQGAAGNGVMLDFFCITEQEEAGKVLVQERRYDVTPKPAAPEPARANVGDAEQNSADSSAGYQVCYRYANGEPPVYLSLFWERVRTRELHTGCLEDALSTRLSNSDHTYDDLTMSFSGSFQRKQSDPGYYHNTVAEAVFVPAGQTSVIFGCIGTKPLHCTEDEVNACWERHAGRMKLCGPDGDKASGDSAADAGSEYAFSVRLLKAALFSNVVYPIDRHGKPVIHYTPGKRWDSLYTWDSGMIGLGMLEYSPERAEYIMDLYLSEEENQDFAFLFHGSMVPTQFFLWYELLQRATGEKKKELAGYYPMFYRYYRFFAGKAEGSTTARYASGLLTPYDYFYNASGMDDYPAQAELHRLKEERHIAPVCTSVFMVRIAQMMKAIATYCGREEETAEYEADIRRVSEALLTHSWDEESGYFGYVRHDDAGNAAGILRTKTGENYNRGIDGVTPLIAGIGSGRQTARMLGHLRSKEELWSPVGLSTVDMSASYFYDNGYWNGSVWFPYQFLLFKAMLDLGEADIAYAIAAKALDAWKKETEFSYHTFEMIQIRSERGGWYHQFGGLSAPVCSFYAAYYKPGTVTAGFDTWIRDREASADGKKMRICYQRNRACSGVLLVVTGESRCHEVFLNGEAASYREYGNNTLAISLTQPEGEILIR